MPNKYAGICYRCGQRVEPGAGVFERTGPAHRQKWLPEGSIERIPKWLLQHHNCAALYKGRKVHHKFYPDKHEEWREFDNG